MLKADEIVQSLTGAWKLFIDRPDAMHYFDVSIDGFWRSFAAILLVLPAYVILMIAERIVILSEPIVDPVFGEAAFVTNNSFILILDWIALPIILALVAGPLGVGRNYASYIVARNWCAVLATAPFGVLAILSLIGLIPGGVASVLMLVALIVVIRYYYMITRRALGADVGLAIGIVIADLAISYAIMRVTDALIPYSSAAP